MIYKFGSIFCDRITANPFSSAHAGTLPKLSNYLRTRRVLMVMPRYLESTGFSGNGLPFGKHLISLSQSSFLLSWQSRFGDRLCASNVLFSFRITKQWLKVIHEQLLRIVQSWFYSGTLFFAHSNTIFCSMLSISLVALTAKAMLYLAYRQRNTEYKHLPQTHNRRRFRGAYYPTTGTSLDRASALSHYKGITQDLRTSVEDICRVFL